MPETRVVFFREADGTVPVRDWLMSFVARRDPRALAKCRDRLRLLGSFGRDLRRPYSDYLRGGIFELRAQHGNVNYRLLYFFLEDKVAVVAHGLTKEAKVPSRDIDLAVTRKALCEEDPERHVYEEADQ